MKMLVIGIIVLLVIYGVYYIVSDSQFLKLFTIPRTFNPFSTSTTPTPAPRTTARTTTRTTTTAPPATQTPTVHAPTPPEGFSVDDLSPFYDKVRLASVHRPDRYGIGGDFSIAADRAATDGVDVTGWQIRSNRGSVVIFGSYGARGPVNHARIVIRPNTQGIFYAAWSSFVKNIELNACTGYLNGTYAVTPKFPNNCPRPSRSELVSFTGACQNFVNSLSSCEIPDPAELNQVIVSGDAACRAFLDNLTYDGCVKRYQNLSNFYSYGWRAWMGTELKFDPYHDHLFLYDTAGKLVDDYVY